MHEVAIVQSLLEVITEQAESEGASKITEVELEFGELSGIEQDALTFCYNIAVKNTMAENSKLLICRTPSLGKCSACGSEFEMHDYFEPCPDCSMFNIEIISGKELKVRSIYIE